MECGKFALKMRLKFHKKIDGPRAKSRVTDKSKPSRTNETDRALDCPLSISSSESEDDADASSALNPLMVGENTWYENASLDVQDPRTGIPIHVQPPRMVWSAPGGKTRMDYFNIFLSESFVEGILEWSNASIEAEKDHIQTWDLRRFLAAMYAMTLVRSTNIKEYWSIVDDSFLPPSDFQGKLEISYDRFAFIRQHLKFGPEDDNQSGSDCVRHLFEEFNNNLNKVFVAGPDLVMDESTSGWKGVDEKHKNGPPALTHSLCKPANASFMIKTMTNGTCGIIIRMELQEGKKAVKKMMFSDVMKPATAVVRRMLVGFESGGRVVTADSGFTNMNTLKAVKATRNYYVGIVKTGHAGIPKKWFLTTAFAGKEHERGLARTQ